LNELSKYYIKGDNCGGDCVLDLEKKAKEYYFNYGDVINS